MSTRIKGGWQWILDEALGSAENTWRKLPESGTLKSKKVKARISKTISEHAVANTWWDPSSLASWLTVECYVQRIQPLLVAKKFAR